MRQLALLLPILLLLSCKSFSQNISIPQHKAKRIIDSLMMLPKVRKEALLWQKTAGNFKNAADSARWALTYASQALTAQQKVDVLKSDLLKDAEIKVDWWKKIARRRSFVSYALAVLSAALGVFAITH